MATIIAAAVLVYGPQVLEWFKTATPVAVEGLFDLLSGAGNLAKDALLPDGTTNPEAKEPEYEIAMRHSNISRNEFRILLDHNPTSISRVLDPHAGVWRRANHRQRNMYRAKWDLPSTWQWPYTWF